MINITLLTMCQDDFCIRKSCFRAFVSIKFGYLKWLFSTKRLVTKKTKALKRGLLMQKSFWHTVGKVKIMKNGFSKKKFRPKISCFDIVAPQKADFLARPWSQRFFGYKFLFYIQKGLIKRKMGGLFFFFDSKSKRKRCDQI